jgi:arylsulfatase A-like enzyme
MRILYIDIDSLRPDHLGCYGYHRDTSPIIDRVARAGVRFENCYVSDAPCLPSRTAMWSGRFGIHTGVINHGGVAADPFVEGAARDMRTTLGRTSWMYCLRQCGLRTVTISPFAERHGAWHWYANFNETYNTGKYGAERADEIAPVALRWIRAHGREDGWFLHVNFWDPHTPYRSPGEYFKYFEDEVLPTWYTEEVRRQHWAGVGPHSAREVNGYGDEPLPEWPRQPTRIDSMDAARRVFDGYDAGVRFCDEHIGRLLDALAGQGVLDETAIIISADHGENLGELNIYCDHMTADQTTCRLPLIVKWPGMTTPRVDAALHYQVDFAATTVELLGGDVPSNWDGRSFADAFRTGRETGRECLVVSQGAWSCQRSVRFDDYLAIRSYHDGYHAFPEVMLFDVKDDPHEQRDLAASRSELVGRAAGTLDAWHADMLRTATHPVDPMWIVMREGGPHHCAGYLPAYLDRLCATGRENWARLLAEKHPGACRRR